MGSYLAKSPLTALIFAAVWQFAMALMPVSQGYAEVLGGFQMTRVGYLFMIAYGLWLSIITAMIFGSAKDKGIKLFLLASVSFSATQWVAPLLPQLRFGETTGAMSLSDTLFKLAGGCVSVILLLLMAAMLFKPPHPPQPETPNAPHPVPDKYKIKVLNLIIVLVVLPVVYLVICVLAWYFLLWRSADVQVYYAGASDAITFGQALVNLVLTNASQIPITLVKGLCYALALLPMLFQLASKRVMFIITTIMLFLGAALQMLIPSPVMPDAVRTAHLIEIAVESVLYGALCSLMLHTSMRKLEPPPAPASVTPGRPAAKAAAAPAAPAK